MVIEDKFHDFFMDPKTGHNRCAGWLLLAYCSPLFLVLAIAVRVDTGKAPVESRGSGGLWRFRTIRDNDLTDTAFGGFLRKTRLDLLPRLYNVARGDITIMDALQ